MINHEDVVASLAAEATEIEKSLSPRSALVDAGLNLAVSILVPYFLHYVFGVPLISLIIGAEIATNSGSIYKAFKKSERLAIVEKYKA